MRTLRLIGTFYKSFVIASSIITISCMQVFYKYGIDIFAVLFWFKIATLGLIFYYINNYKKNEFYYYQNLGLSKLFLWISTIIIDLSFFIILLITVIQIR